MRRRSKFFREKDSDREADESLEFDADDLSDLRMEKRVRFVDDEIDSQRVRVSRGGTDATLYPRPDAPKTSEYAYFKKVRQGATHDHASSLHKENRRLKIVNGNYVSKGAPYPSYKLKHSTNDLRFSVSGEMPEPPDPSDSNVSVSPLISKRDHSCKIGSKVPIKEIEKSSLSLSDNVTPVQQNPFSSRFNEPSDNSESKYIEKGIFSTNREKLRQLAHVSLSEVEKLQTKGYDLVSSLLSRLFPVDYENNYSVIDGSDGSPTIHDSSDLEKGFHLPRNRKCDGSLPVTCFDWSNEMAPLGWNQYLRPVSGNCHREHSSHFSPPSERLRCSRDGSDGSPAIHESNNLEEGFHLHHKREWDGGPLIAFSGRFNEIAPLEWNQYLRHLPGNSPREHYFSFCSPSEKLRHSGSFHLKELDDFGSMMEHFREEPHKHLLEWDSKRGKRLVFSSNTNPHIQENRCPGLAISYNINQQQIEENWLATNALSSSSLLANSCIELDSFPDYGPVCYLPNNFGPTSDAMPSSMAGSEQYPLALPFTPKFVILPEDIDMEARNVLCNDSIILPSRNQDKLATMWDGKYQRGFSLNSLLSADFSTEIDPWQHPETMKSSSPLLEEATIEPPISCEGEFDSHNLWS